MPEPPVMEVILARRKLARTAVTLRASPVVTVEVSMVEYCASASMMADCRTTLIAEGRCRRWFASGWCGCCRRGRRSWGGRIAGWPVLRRALRN